MFPVWFTSDKVQVMLKFQVIFLLLGLDIFRSYWDFIYSFITTRSKIVCKMAKLLQDDSASFEYSCRKKITAIEAGCSHKLFMEINGIWFVIRFLLKLNLSIHFILTQIHQSKLLKINELLVIKSINKVQLKQHYLYAVSDSTPVRVIFVMVYLIYNHYRKIQMSVL